MKNETTGFRAASGRNDIANGKDSIKRTVQGNTTASRDADEPATAGKKNKMEEKNYARIRNATKADRKASRARKTTKQANKSGRDTKQTQTVRCCESTNILQSQNFWKWKFWSGVRLWCIVVYGGSHAKRLRLENVWVFDDFRYYHLTC